MHNPVADCRYFRDIIKHSMIWISNYSYKEVYGCLVIRTILFQMIDFSSRNFMHYERIANNNTFYHSFSDDFFFVPVKELILDRRTTAI